MGNNVFQSPFNITAAAINGALANSGLSLPAGAAGAPSLNFGAPLTGFYSSSAARIDVAINGQNRMRLTSDLSLGSSGAVLWSSGTSVGAADVSLSREAAGVLALNGGVSPQAFRLYNTYTDSSNYERGCLRWNANVLELGPEAAGTGSTRAVRIGSGATAIGLEDAANPGGASVGAYRNGTSGTTQFAVGGTGLTSTSLLHTRLMPSINQASGSYTILDINPTETAVGAGPHYLVRGRLGAGADVFNVQRDGTILAGALVRLAGTTSSFSAIKRNGVNVEARLADDSGYTDFFANSLVTTSNTIFFSAGGHLNMPSDGVLKLGNTASTSFDRLQFGGTTSGFPAIKKHASGGIFQFRKADDSAFTDVELGYVRFSAVTVAGLGSASGAGAGTVRYVTDATATTPRSVAAGGGSNKVMVWSDGTNWLIF